MTRKIYICLLCCFAGLILFSVRARAEDDLAETVGPMHTWRIADGLPSDSVTAIIQTRDGFLWIGTTAGLARFDGVQFTKIPLDVSVTNKPISVTALCEDSRGFLWIGTQQNGLFRMAHGTMRHYTSQDGLLDNDITSLAADAHGQVWIGEKSGLNLWTGHRFKSFTTADGLLDEFVSGVNVARSGMVWITTRSGMCRYVGGHIRPYAFKTESQGRSPEYLGAYEDRRGNIWAFGDTYLINLAEGKRFNYFRSSESASVRIWSLCEGRNGRLWIGTSGRGLFCFENNRFQPVILDKNRWPYDVRAIFEDREGNLWLGTSGGGIVQLRPQSVHVLQAGQGLPSSLPTALAMGADGRIYVGVQRGGLYVDESGRFDPVGGSGELPLQNFISSVCVDNDGTLWAGTFGDGLYCLHNGRGIHLTTADGLSGNSVLAVCADAKSGLWVSTADGALQHLSGGKSAMRFDSRQILSGTSATALIPASDGCWIGTQNGQILREKNGAVFQVEKNKNFQNRAVLTLYRDKRGRIWSGSDGGGLRCLINGTEMVWTTSNGLPDNVVSSVIEDGANDLWLCTGAGIYQVGHEDLLKAIADPKIPLACKLMSSAKTAPESTTVFGGERAVLGPDGELWFATSDGVLNVDTHQVEISPSNFPVYIENVAFNGEPPVSLLQGNLWSTSSATNTIFFDAPDLQSLEIHFTALSFVSPKKVHFRHKLVGFDSDWVDDGNVRSARYGRLPYGHYHFLVAAQNGDGKWQQAATTFAFTIPTPLYVQWWAIGLYVLAAIALIAGTVRVVSHRRLRLALARLEQQQLLERERMRIARDMHDEMGSKLTKISFLSEHAQVDAKFDGTLAKKIDSIAQTSRELLQTMDEIVWVVNPRNDTLENLTAYLSHYAVEYFQNTSIECELKLPPEMPHYPLSSEARHNLFLTFEETLNNVLKHSGAAKVKVEISVAGREFELKVTDNGKGFDTTTMAPGERAAGGRGGNGLKNMRQRLTAIGGECFISSRPGAGASVTMRVPLPKRSGENL